MKVLIAGATGAIGKPLLSCLDDAGHELFALVRPPREHGEVAAKAADEVVADALGAGPDAVYYATKLRGASNQKARGQLAFRPRPLEWL